MINLLVGKNSTLARNSYLGQRCATQLIDMYRITNEQIDYSSILQNGVDEQFSAVQSIDLMSRRRDMRDDPTEILFQSFLQEAIVNISGMGRAVHSLLLSIQHLSLRTQSLGLCSRQEMWRSFLLH